MKYIIILTLLLSGCYAKRIETLEKNQKTIVDAINYLGQKITANDEKNSQNENSNKNN